MILTVVSGLILMKRRMMMEVFPPGIRKLWKDWELRALVFLSLASQMLLIFLGNRRKYIPKTWIKVVVWSAYLLADAVATMALGVLLNNIGEIYDNGGVPNSNGEIAAFWAPFVLLHLGGPNTITEYSLEDNELYLRHAFQLLFQTLTTVLIFLTAWNGSRISVLAIPMIIVGFIKYGERTWTLWSVSSNQLRELVLSSAAADSNYPKFLDEYPLYLAKGYKVERDFMIDAPAFKINMPESGKEFNSDQKIILAYALFHIFKCLFADLSTSDIERESIEPLLKDMSHKDVFSVIAIELGFMYDMLYTKAIVIHTRWGLIRRVISTCLTSLVLVIFCFLAT
ncbi:hypothetical protein Pint_29233 [Pistacia integerrima]|uniref:Uncharacterized protein n=1 Tax=Pistacia integerrima TaxID=434235 RepID=A0ACC0X3N7_9ROSI|nr:hypothetical protein Pint_29233 [Pistacia integerrima]